MLVLFGFTVCQNSDANNEFDDFSPEYSSESVKLSNQTLIVKMRAVVTEENDFKIREESN